MATFKLQLSAHVKANGKQSIELRITVNRKNIPRITGYEVRKKDWNPITQQVRATHENHIEINDALRAKLIAAEKEFAASGGSGVSVHRAIAIPDDFYEFADARISAMTGETEVRTARKYAAWLAGMKEHAPTLTFEQITPDFIDGYRAFLKKKGNKHNTIVGRLASLRAMVNAIPPSKRPTAFKETPVGSYRPAEAKEPLSVQDITTLWNYQPTAAGDALTRDTFLFSYYAAGMRIGDVISLKWADISKGRIVYAEDKKKHLGKAKLYIPLNAYAQELIDRQPREGIYIFGELTGRTREARVAEIESRESTMNRNLMKIALRTRIGVHMTCKVARDTFADIANKRSQRNVYGIQQAMGHSSIKVTEIYLGRDQTSIDELLEKVYKD